MTVQFFITHAPVIFVSTTDGMVASPGLQMQCGICPVRVFVQQLTNLLPLMEHARTHEPHTVEAQCGGNTTAHAHDRRVLVDKVFVGHSSGSVSGGLSGSSAHHTHAAATDALACPECAQR